MAPITRACWATALDLVMATATDKAMRTGMAMRKSTAMRMDAAISTVTGMVRAYGKRVVSTNMVEATEVTCMLFDATAIWRGAVIVALRGGDVVGISMAAASLEGSTQPLLVLSIAAFQKNRVAE